ncbi:MAG: LysR family transcriptional regulator [Oscillospiraceae bacterium]|nr:LysR family transcriptional regulator [Oscillospiraceae bacterium]
MDIRELQYIVAISQTKSITRAAHDLFISQPALHKTLRKVEAELGTELFFRRGNELLPTEAGLLVLKYARDILAGMDSLKENVAAMRNLKMGNVSIGLPSIVAAMFFAPILTSFKKKYPGIHVNSVESGGVKLGEMVAREKLDMAVIMRPVEINTLNEIPILRDHIAIGVLPDHPYANYGEISLKMLEGKEIVTFNDSFSVREKLDSKLRAADVHPIILWEGYNTSYLYSLAALSNSMLILPRPMIDLHNTDDMKTIMFEKEFPWELTIVFRKNSYMSAPAKTFMKYVQDYFIQYYPKYPYSLPPRDITDLP